MIIVRLGTLFTLNAHDADHLRAIARRATTDATDAISLRDLRMGHMDPVANGIARASGASYPSSWMSL